MKIFDVSGLARRGMALAGLVVLALPAQALDCNIALGGWGYGLKGNVVNGGEPLDFQRDLDLKGTARQQYALGCAPAQSGWLPALAADYVRIGARGRQNISATTRFGVLQVSPATTAITSAEVNDLEFSARWGWQPGFADLRLLAGIGLTRLDGLVVVADANSGERQQQTVDQTFPLLSLGAVWQPTKLIALRLNGEYISYKGDTAQGLEALASWQFLGPLGLEAGWRMRRYAVSNNSFSFDARLSGARVGMRFEFPL